MSVYKETTMFYGALPTTFVRARSLRNSMTNVESLLWEKLRKNQLLGFRFKPQHPLFVFIADFYCHKARLVIEVDGKIHLNRKEYDQNREEVIKQLNLSILSFTNEEVEKDIDRVLDIIKGYLLAIPC
ncbi:MAG: DUF559 domain-containing protein [Bacteroidetes bacterium]|nr:DUF559 domain-containing protein [Bacteroidota bacterium]